MKRHIIISFVILSIFNLNLFAAVERLHKHDIHGSSCSFHEHQHTHNTLKHTHNHSHKINLVDFYISDIIEIKLSSYLQKNNYEFTQEHFYSISPGIFRPPII
ncbi:hypothetical protein [Sulfurimonas sp.]|uniref:hypothetical protein n=1 Tax=Sulfurimonas sp. TaxID=2022749 RepID=UPI003562519C